MTGGYKWLQEVTGCYKGLQEVTGGYKGLQGITRGCRGLQGVQGVTDSNRWLQIVRGVLLWVMRWLITST